MGCFCWSMLPECYLGAHVNPLDWRSPCADFRPVPEASPTTALLLSVGGGSVSESNRSAAFGPLSGFEDHAHHRMKYAPEYSLAAARTSHGNEPLDTFWATPTTDSIPPPPPVPAPFSPLRRPLPAFVFDHLLNLPPKRRSHRRRLADLFLQNKLTLPPRGNVLFDSEHFSLGEFLQGVALHHHD